jgi:hypothetical protein
LGYTLTSPSALYLDEWCVGAGVRCGATVLSLGQVQQHLLVVEGFLRDTRLLQGDDDGRRVVRTQHPLAPPQEGVAHQLASAGHPARRLGQEVFTVVNSSDRAEHKPRWPS